jgi:hypothetical protein
VKRPNKVLPYITLRTTDHAVIGVSELGQTFSEPTEDPKAWAEGFLVAYRFAGGEGELLEWRPGQAQRGGDFLPIEVPGYSGLDNEDGTRS